MKNPLEDQNSKTENPPDAVTGLPLLRTWPAVYTFILTAFLLTVLALALFTAHYAEAK